ncbi:hypothetical protein M153_6330003141 [Pseudoloma neurophilia]|uniref:Uncharacterized protein n=1 Tax=Pseudoloma neurophilia TaxID=146866 RepID=A0A0R0M2N8_9MICR|nr:hypothetical protein M153_6330003141 [Pseudoloma neurophilia]
MQSEKSDLDNLLNEISCQNTENMTEKETIEALHNRIRSLEKKLQQKKVIIDFLMKSLRKTERNSNVRLQEPIREKWTSVLNQSEQEHKHNLTDDVERMSQLDKYVFNEQSQLSKANILANVPVGSIKTPLEAEVEQIEPRKSIPQHSTPQKPVPQHFVPQHSTPQKPVPKTTDTPPKQDQIFAPQTAVPVQAPIKKFSAQPTIYDTLAHNPNTQTKLGTSKQNPNSYFKANASFSEYFSYLETLYVPFVLDQPDDEKELPKIHQSYLRNNYNGLTKAIFEKVLLKHGNPNNLNVSFTKSQIKLIFTFFHCLGKILSVDQKIMILHDLLIFCTDYNLVFFWAYSLIKENDLNVQGNCDLDQNKSEVFTEKQNQSSNNEDIGFICNILSQLLSYQGLIMIEQGICHEMVDQICQRMSWTIDLELEPILERILSSDVYNEKMAVSLRIIAAYMDWDWTFNNLVLGLIDRTSETGIACQNENMRCAYLGILLELGQRMIGQHESIQVIVDHLMDILKSEQDEKQKEFAAYGLKDSNYYESRPWLKE